MIIVILVISDRKFANLVILHRIVVIRKILNRMCDCCDFEGDVGDGSAFRFGFFFL